MTDKYLLTEPARNDLKDVWTYIAEHDTNTANKFLRELAKKFKLFAENPKIGRLQDNVILNLRSFPFKNYVIFYFIGENRIEIYRVLHGARDIEWLFEDFFEGLKP